MAQLSVRHFHLKINKAFVHLVQYGNSESVINSLRLQNSVSSRSPSPSRHNDPNRSYIDQSPSTNAALLAGNKSAPISGPSNEFTDNNKVVRKLVVFIPGNPGVLGMYHDFLVALHRTLSVASDEASEQIVILAMSHNNFDHPDHCDYPSDERIFVEDSEMNFFEQFKAHANCDPHHIDLQAINKLFILKRLLKVDLKQIDRDGCELVFVGHSIGCYVILKLLQDKALAEAHSGSILVHPALENLALTEQGNKIANLFALKLDYLLRAMAFAVAKVIPKSARLAIVKWYCPREFVESSSEIVIGSMEQLVHSVELNALIRMAKSEFVSIKDLNHDKMIKPHVDKLKLIYTKGDRWANDGHRLELIQSYPDLHIEQQQTLHAFIMDPIVVRDYTIKIAQFIREYFRPKQ